MAAKLKKPLGDITAAAAAVAPVVSGGSSKGAAMGGAGGPSSSAGASGGSGGASGKTLEQIYQKVSQREHILLRPDSYIGSNQKHVAALWVWDAAKARIVQQMVSYVPGLYKIYDEILVNAADNKQRDKSMTMLKVVVDPASNTISVWNNGKGIPIAMHAEQKVYIPELIFGHLLTSSNYDDDEKKVVGGRNGYGAKLANIFSTRFTIETADGARGLKYSQTFTGNMGVKGEPVISSHTGPDFTCITFTPDLARFGMASLDEQTVSLLCRRAVDMAGVLGKGVAVYLNGARIPVSSFPEYVALYEGLGDGDVGPVTALGAAPAPPTRIWERVNERWEVCLSLTEGIFSQVSFVNAIATSKGGQHVTYLADQIANAVAEAANKKNKGSGVEIKPMHVRGYMQLFVNCLVENPAFDSQTKDTLTTRPKDFGSTAELSPAFIKKVLASGIVERVQNWAKFKATTELQKAAGGKKPARFVPIPKLDDANFAGHPSKAADCTLILTEGDSAKSLAVAGMSVVGRDYFGVFPLRGKLLNVREASHKQIMNNAEITALVTILGLQYGKTYDSVKGLRYGHLMIMADQDHDGSHIKGLVLNLLHCFWPSLLALDGFLQQFITPIVKAVPSARSRDPISFFTLPQYSEWKQQQLAIAAAKGGAAASSSSDAAAMTSALKGWAIKYYKGLGTSTSVEAKEYFSDLRRHRLAFALDDPRVTGHMSGDLVDLAFSKKRADDRKEWLKGFVPGTHVDYETDRMLVSDFICKELILFSMADNVRSIPSLVDGLKPAQRKVLFACFKRNLKTDIKVAQLAGYVSEHSAYHHGEQALAATIVGMAQNFVGSNNINLLVPSGQFGTRLMGGKDAASARYIFTRLAPITRALFHPDDDALLAYQDEDGQSIEPSHYVPVIPLVLVNGAEGIGTGWSTSIPNYNPRDVIAAVRARLTGDDGAAGGAGAGGAGAAAAEPLRPWYRGFKGTIEARGAAGAGSYVASGIAEVAPSGDVLRVSELPVGRWTQDYKGMLVSYITGDGREDADAKGPKGGKPGAKGKAGAKPKARAGAAKTAAGGAKGAKGKAAAAAEPAADGDAAAAPAKGKAAGAAKPKAASAAAAAKAKAAPKPKKSKKAMDEDDGDDGDDGSDFSFGDDGSDSDGSDFAPAARPARKAVAAPKAKAAGAPKPKAAAKSKAKKAGSDDDDDGDSIFSEESSDSSDDHDDGSDDDFVAGASDSGSDAEDDDDLGSLGSDGEGGGKAGKGKKKAAAGKAKAGEAKPKAERKPKEPVAPLLPPGEPIVKEFAENHTDTAVSFTITVTPPVAALMAPAAGAGSGAVPASIRKVFKLESPLSTANMHLFDAEGRIARYGSAEAIIDAFLPVRMDFYGRRKAHLLAKLKEEVERLSNRARFVSAVLSGELKVAARKRGELLSELHDAGYKGFESAGPGESEEDAAAAAAAIEAEATGVGKAGRELSEALLARRYNYLLSMPLWALTAEKVAALRAELAAREVDLDRLRRTSTTAMWLADLAALEAALDAADAEFEAETAGAAAAGKRKGAAAARGGAGAGRKTTAPARKPKKALDSDDDDDDVSDEDEWDEDEDDDDSDFEGGGRKGKGAKAKAPVSRAAFGAAAGGAGGASKAVLAAAIPKPAVARTFSAASTASAAAGISATAAKPAAAAVTKPAAAAAAVKPAAASAAAASKAPKAAAAAAVAVAAPPPLPELEDPLLPLLDVVPALGALSLGGSSGGLGALGGAGKSLAERLAEKAAAAAAAKAPALAAAKAPSVPAAPGIKRAKSDERAAAAAKPAPKPAARLPDASPEAKKSRPKTAKPAAKGKAKADDSDDESVGTAGGAAAAAARPARRAAAVAKKYTYDSGSDESSEDSSEAEWDSGNDSDF